MAVREFPWSSNGTDPGAQVDLVIERPDKITYLCEMKFTHVPFTIDAACARDLARKQEVFKAETGTSHSVQIVMVTASGLKANAHSGMVARTVEGDDLFVF